MVASSCARCTFGGAAHVTAALVRAPPHDRSPSPDEFPTEFYQVFWEIIEKDLMALFKDFRARTERGSFPFKLCNNHAATKTERGYKHQTIPTYMPTKCLLQNFHKGGEG
jgi:hypothetical protein